MIREVEFDQTWRDELVTIKIKLSGSDPDVGIMGPQPEDIHMFYYDTDTEIPLSDAEIDDLLSGPQSSKLWAAIEDAYYSYPEEDLP